MPCSDVSGKTSKNDTPGIMPASNTPRLYQAAFSIVALIVFWGDYKLISCFGIFLFIFPQFIDVASLKLKFVSWLNITRWVFVVLYFFIIVFCVLEWRMILTDSGDAFKIANTAIYLAGETLSKKVVAWVLLLHPIMYIILFFGIPTKRTVYVEEQMEKSGYVAEEISPD